MSAQPVASDSAGLSGSHFQQAVQLLARRKARAERLAVGLTVGAAVYEVAKKLHGRARDALAYTVAVPVVLGSA